MAKFRRKRPHTKSIEAINKKSIKENLEKYIKNYQHGLFREPGNTAQYKEAMKNIARTQLTEVQLNNPNLLSSLFKALVKSDPPFSEQLTNDMLQTAALYLEGKKEQAKKRVKEICEQAEPPAAQKAWFKDTLYLMKLAYHYAPDTGRDGLTDKKMLCNFFANSLFQFPKPEIPQTLTSEAAIIIRNESQKQLEQAELSLTILLSIED